MTSDSDTSATLHWCLAANSNVTHRVSSDCTRAKSNSSVENVGTIPTSSSKYCRQLLCLSVRHYPNI